MSHPHLNQVDRDAIEDRGLVEGSDRTPDMRKPPAGTRGLQLNPKPPTITKEVHQ